MILKQVVIPKGAILNPRIAYPLFTQTYDIEIGNIRLKEVITPKTIRMDITFYEDYEISKKVLDTQEVKTIYNVRNKEIKGFYLKTKLDK